MSVAATIIVTFDNHTLDMPDNQVRQYVMKNVTDKETRQVDMLFGISWSDEVEDAEGVLQKIGAASAKIPKQPEPLIKLH